MLTSSQLANAVWEKSGSPEGQACLIFSASQAALACQTFAKSAFPGKEAIRADEISIRHFESVVGLYAVFFPAAERSSIQPFWAHTGTGISSRLAEACFEKLDLLREVSTTSITPMVSESAAHGIIRQRIADLVERAPVGPPRAESVTSNHVYLFPTGMAAIDAVHGRLLRKKRGTTVLFGFPFRSTCYLFENFGPGCKLFGTGSAQEVQELDQLLRDPITKDQISVQAIWTEFPANPMLTSADLKALRKLADTYNIPLIVDDTIGSFCNIDVLGVADILVTSLTKSFSGYADVMGGSVLLNPSSTWYTEFSEMFSDFQNDYWKEDAEVLEPNSKDYLSRSSVLNSNAERLVAYLQSYATNPNSTLTRIFYPTVNSDAGEYQAFMRPKTADFTPGYGCLFTLEFESVEAAIAFYDNLSVYNGPHLGAHLTLAMAYVKGLYSKQLDWASKYGLKEAQIRISVGLEEFELLREAFESAMQTADAIQS